MKIMKIAMVCILCTTITFVSSSVFAIGIKPSLVIGVLTTLVIRYFLRNLICRIELFFYEIWGPFSNFSGKGLFVGGLERRELLAAG